MKPLTMKIFLEIKENALQKKLKKDKEDIRKGKFGSLEDLYKIHRKKILSNRNNGL